MCIRMCSAEMSVVALEKFSVRVSLSLALSQHDANTCETRAHTAEALFCQCRKRCAGYGRTRYQLLPSVWTIDNWVELLYCCALCRM